MRYKSFLVLLQIICLLGGGSVPMQAQHLRSKAKSHKPALSGSRRTKQKKSSKKISRYESKTASATTVQGLSAGSLKEENEKRWLSSEDQVYMKKILQQLREKLPALAQSEIPFVQRHPFVQSIFQARDISSTPIDAYSGGLFQLDGEIYGVIAAHALGGVEREERLLGRYFLADVYYNEDFISIPAEAVLFNPMLDVALVTFSWDHVEQPGFSTKDLRPLELADDLPQVGQTLSSYGFINSHDLAEVQGRTVTEVYPLSIRTMMPWPRGFRSGLCGSLLPKGKTHAFAFHIGSTSDKKVDEKQDVGFATPAWVLRVMVEAFKNGGEAYFPLEFNGYEIAKLRADEYISFMTLYDKQGKVLWKGAAKERFSFHSLEQLLVTHHPHTLQLTLGRAGWVDAHSMNMREQISVRKVRYEFPEDFFIRLKERNAHEVTNR